MEYLLDTHSFLWFINGDEQLDVVSHGDNIDPANLPFLDDDPLGLRRKRKKKRKGRGL